MLSANLKAARRKCGFTQDDVASFLNVKRQTYSAYERGASVPDAITLQMLAGCYNVTADYLLTGKDAQMKFESEDMEELFMHYKALDKRGKTLVMAEAYRQYDRCVGTVEIGDVHVDDNEIWKKDLEYLTYLKSKSPAKG